MTNSHRKSTVTPSLTGRTGHPVQAASARLQHSSRRPTALAKLCQSHRELTSHLAVTQRLISRKTIRQHRVVNRLFSRAIPCMPGWMPAGHRSGALCRCRPVSETQLAKRDRLPARARPDRLLVCEPPRPRRLPAVSDQRFPRENRRETMVPETNPTTTRRTWFCKAGGLLGAAGFAPSSAAQASSASGNTCSAHSDR